MSHSATDAQLLAVAITTATRPRDAECELARRLAAETSYDYVPRDRRPLAEIAMAAQCEGLLVVERGDHHIVIGEAVDAHADAPIEGRPDDAIIHMRELGDNVFYGG